MDGYRSHQVMPTQANPSRTGAFAHLAGLRQVHECRPAAGNSAAGSPINEMPCKTSRRSWERSTCVITTCEKGRSRHTQARHTPDMAACHAPPAAPRALLPTGRSLPGFPTTRGEP